MAAAIDDVSTAAISLSLAHSDKTAVLTQLQEIIQWMKNKVAAPCYKYRLRH